jgi:hypothetical protein
MARAVRGGTATLVALLLSFALVTPFGRAGTQPGDAGFAGHVEQGVDAGRLIATTLAALPSKAHAQAVRAGTATAPMPWAAAAKAAATGPHALHGTVGPAHAPARAQHPVPLPWWGRAPPHAFV